MEDKDDKRLAAPEGDIRAHDPATLERLPVTVPAGRPTETVSEAPERAGQFPQYASQITAAAKSSFLDGANWAYTAGIIAVLAGATLVFFMFPKQDEEIELLEQYHATDIA